MGDQYKYRDPGRASMDLRPQTPLSEPPQPLSEREKARAAEMRAQVHQHMPELVPFIKELHGFGMIDGYRNVKEVRLIGEDNG